MKQNNLTDKRVIITGCGYKPVNYIFNNIVDGKPSHDPIMINEQEMKMNIGTACAKVLAENGATVHMVAKSEEKLNSIQKALSETIDKRLVEYSPVDLMDESSVHSFIQSLPKDKDIYWVQSIGLGAGSYKVKDDNPYLPLEQIDVGLLEAETNTTLRATHLLMKEILPIMRGQKETRIAIVTSMSAIRGYAYGGKHCAAKGAIDRYTNSAMLALYKDNIFVTTVRPGGVDTGLYDNPIVQEAVMTVADEYYCEWRKNGIRLAPPSVVGEAVNYIFSTAGHIPSINIVAQGQFPNEGS